MTQHALDRMAERGVSRPDVIAVIEHPDLTHDSAVPDVRVAQRADVRVVYNHLTGDVLTVARRDEDQQLEQQVSGWINLDAKQAEKLLVDWGFEIHSAKDKSNLWTHPIDEQKRLIPFSIPSRGAKANGKGSFRTAAQVVNVSVNEFLKGPPADWADRMAVLRKIEDAARLIDGPDPLGINRRVVEQATAQIVIETDRLTRATATPAKENTMPEHTPVPVTYTPVEEKVLAGLLEATEPITARELSTTLGIHDVTARDGLRKAVRLGDAFVVGKRKRHGAPADTFWHEPTWEQPAPDPDPVPATAPEETPVSQPSVIDLAASTPSTTLVDAPKEKLFTATGTPWPTGGILIQDEDGAYYVARKLVEEGR